MKHLNTHRLVPHARIRLGGLATVLGFALAAPSAFAGGTESAFEMVVYSHSPQGRRLIDGDWDEALAMSEALPSVRFEALNNRCVSLTVAGELERAEPVCDGAVRSARRSAASRAPGVSSRGVGDDVRTNGAMALTNRGVLRALQGDVTGAREDFEAAVELGTRVKAARSNLAKLGEAMTVARAE